MRKTKYILKGFLAVVMAVMFVQCAEHENCIRRNRLASYKIPFLE